MNTLSICMIVKDEEKNIEDALWSFAPIADEIIYMDTGSTDKTKEIFWNSPRMKEHKKKWPYLITQYNHIWKNDFAEARNMSMAVATCDWILWLDADDRIPESEIEKFKTLKQAPKDRFFLLKIRDTINGLPLGREWMQTRMFPNVPSVCFTGAIHEQVTPSLFREGFKPVEVDCTILHTGYDDPETKCNKALRNGAIMEACGYGNGNTTETMALAANYYLLGEWRKGIDTYEKITDKSSKIYSQIGMGYYNLKSYEKAIQMYVMAGNDNIEAVYQRAMSYEKLKDFEAALKYYQLAIDLPNTYSTQPIDYDFCRMHAFHRAFIILEGLKRHKEALLLLQNMHHYYPDFRMEL